MKALGWLAILFLAASSASAQVEAVSAGRPWPSPPQRPTGRPLPGVVRVVSPEKDGVSLGSGSLISVQGEPGAETGIIITNWHVVRDGSGDVTIVFPDGVRKPGKVLKMDPDWDLAAIHIDRPHVSPVELSAEAPQRGDPLTIAGYGSGKYRAAGGRCTQYLSPGGKLPFEIVELSVAARQGDSGGPILNSRGQLAGVLFGAGQGTTSGTYCLRVREFLGSLPKAEQPKSGVEAAETLVAVQPGGRSENPLPSRERVAAQPPGEGTAGIRMRFNTQVSSGGHWVAARKAVAAVQPAVHKGVETQLVSNVPERLPPIEEGDSPRSDGLPAEETQPVGLAQAEMPGDSSPADCDGWAPAAKMPAADPFAQPPSAGRGRAKSGVNKPSRPHHVARAPLPGQEEDGSPSSWPKLPASALNNRSHDQDREDVPPVAALLAAEPGSNGDPAGESPEELLSWQELAGLTPADQFKSVLAAIGVIGLFLHGFRCLRMV